jgi:WD40 repeat protein
MLHRMWVPAHVRNRHWKNIETGWAFALCLLLQVQRNWYPACRLQLQQILFWDSLAGKLLCTLPGHSKLFSCLGGSVLAKGSFDHLVCLWDTTCGQCLKNVVATQETQMPL